MKFIGNETLTGFQLRDIFNESKSIAKIKKEITLIIKENKIFEQKIKEGMIQEEEEETEAAKKKREEKEKEEVPDVDLLAMLKSIGLDDCSEKLKETKIDDP